MRSSDDERALDELIDAQHATADLDANADLVVTMARDHLDCDFAGVTFCRRKGELETLAATDPIVEKGDRLQYDLREGPCVEAIWSLRDFAAEDVGADPRWPRWGPQAAASGLTGLLAVRMSTSGEVVGCLNLYSSAPRTFTPDEIDFAHVFAHHAAIGLSHARRIDQLRVAVDGRTLIGQAQGILMERFSIDADQAFAVLRRYSQDRNVKLRAIAEELVANDELASPRPVRHRADRSPAD